MASVAVFAADTDFAANVDTVVVVIGAGVDGAIVVVSPPRSPMKACTPWTVATTSCTPTAGQFWMGLKGNNERGLATPGSPLQS